MSSTAVNIAIVGTSDIVGEALSDFLSSNDELQLRSSRTVEDRNSVVALIANMQDCENLGRAVASWLDGREIRFRLRIDGPGGDFELRRLGTAHDERIISGLVASSAGLQ